MIEECICFTKMKSSDLCFLPLSENEECICFTKMKLGKNIVSGDSSKMIISLSYLEAVSMTNFFVLLLKFNLFAMSRH